MGEGYSLDVVSIRLVKDAPIMSDYRLAGAEDVAALMGSVLGDLDKEVVCVINLKADGTPINCNFASMGTVSRSLASPKELFKSSILSNAAMMMLAHNHPSGNLTPSKEDINLTGHMIVLCDMMGIPLVDHVIVGGDSGQYFSFLNNGLMPDVHKKVYTDCGSLQFTAGRKQDGEKNGKEEACWSSKVPTPSKKNKKRGGPVLPDADDGNGKIAPSPAVAERSRKHGTR